MNGFDNNISAEGVKLITEFRFLLNFEQVPQTDRNL